MKSLRLTLRGIAAISSLLFFLHWTAVAGLLFQRDILSILVEKSRDEPRLDSRETRECSLYAKWINLQTFYPRQPQKG